MVTREEELAAAVADRQYWDTVEDGAAAVYTPPSGSTVRIRPLPFPTNRQRYGATLYQPDGVVERSTTAGSAREAVGWAERLA